LSRNDRGFYATGSIGLAYNFSEAFALRLGYRYHHEEEVPAHLAELGLDLEF
jgi:opacity protein-like surface antigen